MTMLLKFWFSTIKFSAFAIVCVCPEIGVFPFVQLISAHITDIHSSPLQCSEKTLLHAKCAVAAPQTIKFHFAWKPFTTRICECESLSLFHFSCEYLQDNILFQLIRNEKNFRNILCNKICYVQGNEGEWDRDRVSEWVSGWEPNWGTREHLTSHINWYCIWFLERARVFSFNNLLFIGLNVCIFKMYSSLVALWHGSARHFKWLTYAVDKFLISFKLSGVWKFKLKYFMFWFFEFCKWFTVHKCSHRSAEFVLNHIFYFQNSTARACIWEVKWIV